MNRHLRVAGIIGLVTPFFANACILLAVASWPLFSWADNALSDLGVQSGITAIVFNSGLVISGLLFIIFGTGLFQMVGKHFVGKVGSTFFILSSVALVAIGVFNESISPTHYIVSVMFFVLLPVSLLILVGTFWLAGNRKLSVFTFAMALGTAVPWVLEFTVHYVSGVAVPEFASGLFGSAWTMVVSYLMIKKSAQSESS